MIRYIFKEDEILAIKGAKDADAQVIGEALAAIATKTAGHLTPEAIVDDARKRTSPLHSHFEWDDKVAAQNFRLDQARSLVRCIHVENTDAGTGVARAFLSIRDREGTSYRAIGDVLKSHDLQQRILAQAERDLIAFEARYKNLEDICEIVRTARARLTLRNEQHATA